MNINHSYYEKALNIYNNWELDDWSITREMYKHIIDILPFGKTILELGSGKSTELLSMFYNLISIEENIEYLKNYFNVNMLYVPLKNYESFSLFQSEKNWYDINILKQYDLKNQKYDLIIVDGPCANRGGFFEFLELFNLDNNNCKYIFFDDTMTQQHLNVAEKVAEKLKKKINTIQCKVNPKVVYWFQGKKYSYIEL